MKIYNIGIIGCGSIAAKMAAMLGGMKGVKRYAVASRTEEKAKAFADKWQFSKAYGSYEALASDSEVDLIYIATPHAMHYDNARLCIEKGKPVLCEKAFTANARQAADLLKLAEEKRVFLTEAIWTRYMPLSLKIRELLEEGVIGAPHILSANLGYVIDRKERILRPETGGRRFTRFGCVLAQLCCHVFRKGSGFRAFRLSENGYGSGCTRKYYIAV